MTIPSVVRYQPPKSRFVTVVGWLGIFSGASTVVASVWSLILAPGVAALAVLPAGLMGAWAGIGLKERREWARRGFIVVQAYGVLNWLAHIARALRAQSAIGGAVGRTAIAATLVGAALFLAINAFITVKLCSRSVRAEFEAAEEQESD